MQTVIWVRVETDGKKFIVTGQFDRAIEVPRQEFETYGDALKALSKVAMREDYRYEHRDNRGINR
jgi:hypothetical protein